MENMNDNELEQLMDKLKQDLQEFPEGEQSLDVELDASVKHIPTYLKIVKSHISQLESVLSLENHNHKTIDSVDLAKPVTQLIKLFETLQDEDIQLLEQLATSARNWNTTEATEAEEILKTGSEL